MTTEYREFVFCPNCGEKVSTEQPINAWIRTNPRLHSVKDCLCIINSDLWIHRYGTKSRRGRPDRNLQWLMLVEMKTHCRDVDAPQRDTLWTIDQVMRAKPMKDQRSPLGRLAAGHSQNVRIVYSYMAGRRVHIMSYGVHRLLLSGSTPDDSIMIWDRTPIDREQLEQLLRFELHPDSLRPMEFRDHKRAIEPEPTLFDLLGLSARNEAA